MPRSFPAFPNSSCVWVFFWDFHGVDKRKDFQNMKLVYRPQDRPPIQQTIAFALQQLLAIMAATVTVPLVVGNGMSPAAAMFGAGVGTLVYLLFTKFKSPVFLGSSFAFISSMQVAFAGALTAGLGYLGLIIGAVFAGLVYVAIAVAVKFAGVSWINKLMPPVVIGPTVALIGLSLSAPAVNDLKTGGVSTASPYLAIICGFIALFVVILCSVYGKGMAKLIPFMIGICAAYIIALILTVIGTAADVPALLLIDFAKFSQLIDGGVGVNTFLTDLSMFTFVNAFGAFDKLSFSYVGTIAVAYIPVAFVVFAEHIADHKNISTIIDEDLLEDPGLSRTLLGDGVGSMTGAFFGGCPNTTYGESVACVAITGNASVVTIFLTSIISIVISFFAPFVAFLNSIPKCIMGGVCIALYGFIAVSGLKMIQKVDLGNNRNLFVVSAILIPGIGGLTLSFGKVQITSIALALILGIIVNLMMKPADKASEASESDGEEDSGCGTEECAEVGEKE